MSKIDRDIVDVLNKEGSAILQIALSVDSEPSKVVEEVISTTRRGNNIFLSGVGKCSFIAEKLAATYCSLGIPSFPLHCTHSLHGDIGAVRPGDVVIIFSKSGETTEAIELAYASKSFSASTIAITCNRDSTLSRACDLRIVLPVKDEADVLNLAPTSSTTAMLAIGDAIGVVVSRHLKFGKSDFNKRHPKGKLGEVSK